jgi:hypothetical protein
LIGSPISLFFLILGFNRIRTSKEKLPYLTRLTLLIYSSEIVNAISRMLQLIKYFFDDDRSNKDASMNMDNSRGIICQIQIVTSVFSDYCSFFFFPFRNCTTERPSSLSFCSGLKICRIWHALCFPSSS